MIVKDVYQSGINVLIDGYKALIEEAGAENVLDYGAKSDAMFDHCQISFFVTDIRGVELITLKKMCSNVKVLSKKSFISPKKLRPTIFSKDYPSVNTTDEYNQFIEDCSEVIQKNISMLNSLLIEKEKWPELYQYNFAGSVSFDALVTFAGNNITQLIGVLPNQALKEKDGSWIDPNGQYFINRAIAAFKRVYYDALDGIFGTTDMHTDVALEKLYFSYLRNRDLSTLDLDHNKIPGVIYAQAYHPFGVLDLITSEKPKTTEEMTAYNNEVIRRLDFVDANTKVTDETSSFGASRGDYLLEHTTFIMYAKCTIQTLLMLHAHTNAVVYYTDMKNILGIVEQPVPILSLDRLDRGNVKVSGTRAWIEPGETVRESVESFIESSKHLFSKIERTKESILTILKKYNTDRDFYEENRYKNTTLRPPKSMIQRKEYYNMVPLYAQTCCVLRFTERDINSIDINALDTWEYNEEFKGIITAMNKFYNSTRNHLHQIPD